MSAPIRVLLADDHAPTRAGVRQVLESEGFSVCAEVASGPAAVETALAEKPEVCLLDIRMPGGGIAAAAEIARSLPHTAIIMLTVSRDDADLFDALRAGARGYLLKDVDRADLPAALRGALAGEAPLPANLVARLIEEFRERGRRKRLLLKKNPGVQLRNREWEVLELLREGLSTAEIAQRLFIAEVTVRSHVSSILRKLHVPDRESAVQLLEER
ncbi:MAG TPA: response regulator transcription factor [Gaiellaceae bacterium]|nr:response regulator transcription factor [Gaiellaceae bacterium]